MIRLLLGPAVSIGAIALAHVLGALLIRYIHPPLIGTPVCK
jgi:hypothetical protein